MRHVWAEMMLLDGLHHTPRSWRAQSTAVHTRADGHNVLERAAQLDADRVLDGADLERGVVVRELEERAVGVVGVANGRLAEGVRSYGAARVTTPAVKKRGVRWDGE